jgi:hypothetical protein
MSLLLVLWGLVNVGSKDDLKLIIALVLLFPFPLR